MRSFPLTLALCLCCFCAPLAECQRRRIEDLPRLLFRPNFTQYSGYLTSGPSSGHRRLFYWLVESSHVDASTAPLVLWMNGGPGCSSVGGLLMTNGPFLANDRAELERNEFAWNRLANVLYIDSPSGVGLSEPGPTDPSVLNDNATAELNLGALLDFYKLFPEYRGRPFYIAGESYAGIYIPLLASAIIGGGHRPGLINLTGTAVGNGLHVPAYDFDVKPYRTAVANALSVFSELQTDTILLNSYSVGQPCYQASKRDSYPCLNTTGLTSFLNDKEARRVLGVSDNSRKYGVCNVEVNCNYRRRNQDVLEHFVKAASSCVSVLLFQGTLDILLPLGITQQLLDRLPADPPQSSGGHDAWLYTLNRPGYGLQIGGVQRSYMGGRIRYRTVIGAGHSVVTDRPEIGLQLLEDLLDSASRSCAPMEPGFYSEAETQSASSACVRLLPLLLPSLRILFSF